MGAIQPFNRRGSALAEAQCQGPRDAEADISRQLVRVWVQKYEAGALDEDAQAADLLQEYEAKIAALERSKSSS
jgi:hypothetical protein